MMQDSLSAAEQWLHKNRLVVNPNKSSFILLGHSSRINDVDLNLIFNDTRLPSCDNTKLLGVVIDSQLRWNEHVTFFLKKVSPKLGLLRRLSALFPSEVLFSLYISIIRHILTIVSPYGVVAAKETYLLYKKFKTELPALSPNAMIILSEVVL